VQQLNHLIESATTQSPHWECNNSITSLRVQQLNHLIESATTNPGQRPVYKKKKKPGECAVYPPCAIALPLLRPALHIPNPHMTFWEATTRARAERVTFFRPIFATSSPYFQCTTLAFWPQANGLFRARGGVGPNMTCFLWYLNMSLLNY